MRGRGIVRAALLMVVALAARAGAAPQPQLTLDDDGRGEFVLDLQNPLPFPITVTVKSRTIKNLRPAHEFPITAVVESFQRSALVRLTPISRSERSEVDSTFTYQPGRATAKHDDRVVYTLPFQAGYAYPLTQGYNGRFSHQGLCALDFAMPEGTPVCAARDGKIISVTQKYAEGGTSASLLTKANEFSVLHDDGTIAVYAHMRKDGISLRVGDYVRAGYPLGYSGNTGFSSGPHLHFEVFRVVDGERQASIPVRFATADSSATTLQEGQTYMRPFRDQPVGQQRAPKNAEELARSPAIGRPLFPGLPVLPAIPARPPAVMLAVLVLSLAMTVLRRLLRRD